MSRTSGDRHTALILFSLVLAISAATRAEEEAVVRLGIIGLDTSHATAFTEYINDPENATGCRVVAAYRGGSKDIPSSVDRLEGFTRTLREDFGVRIVPTIEGLCTMVDGVLLESVDGRPHLEQVTPVFEAGLPVFVDKPAAGNLADVVELFRLAEEHQVPCWSSSSLRYSPGIMGMRSHDSVGDVLGCGAFSPCALEPHHPDLYWYGIHGVEILFTIMGTGCRTVARTQTEGVDMVVGIWDDGRVGTYRGMRHGKAEYGAMVYGSKGIERSGPYTGYAPLLKEIVRFFKTGRVPVPPEETIEIYAFMSAADESKARNGAPVSLEEVLRKATQP